MGSLGIPEIMVILVIALLVFGPHKVPEVARQLGKGMRELRRIQDSLRADVSGLLGVDDDDPTPPFHPSPVPGPGAAPPARPASSSLSPNGRGATAPSRFRAPGGQRMAAPAPLVKGSASTDRSANGDHTAGTPVPRVTAPSRFRTPRRTGATS